MSGEALSGLKVVEFGEFISGPYCGKLLADLGAEVIKVEKPGSGDKARGWGPFPKDKPHPEKSGLFLYLNTNKLGVTLDVSSATGMKIFKELVKWADVLIENNPPREMEKLGFDFESLKKVNPALVVTSITPFGQTGPYRDYKACDLISFHASGEAYINPLEEAEDIEQQPPLKGPVHVGDFLTGLSAAVGTMSAVIARKLTWLGQHVDLSQQEALASILRVEYAAFTYEHTPYLREKTGAAGRVTHMHPCKDGYIMIVINNDVFWTKAVEMMGNPDWALSDAYKDVASRNANEDAIWFMISEWTKERTIKEVLAAAQGKRLPITPVNTMKEVVNSELAKVREFFVEVDHKGAGKVKFPGAPYKLAGTPWRIKCPAPLLGEHNAEVYCRMLGYSEQDLVKMRQAGVI